MSKCVCQVFHHKEGINCWRFAFVFFPKKYCQKAEKYYLEAIEVNKEFLLYFECCQRNWYGNYTAMQRLKMWTCRLTSTFDPFLTHIPVIWVG